MTNKLTELNTTVPQKEQSVEEKIATAQQISSLLDELILKATASHDRIDREKNENK